MNSIIIYGPPGCGKTANKDKLATHYGKSCVIDNWVPGNNIPDNALILTNVPGVADAIMFDEAIENVAYYNLVVNFKDELQKLINKHGVERLADMPDYLLAEMLCNMVCVIGGSVKRTLDWHNTDSVCHPRQR